MSDREIIEFFKNKAKLRLRTERVMGEGHKVEIALVIKVNKGFEGVQEEVILTDEILILD